MKFSPVIYLLSSMSLSFTSYTMAADGQINFTGTLEESKCTPIYSTISVPLGSIGVDTFTGAASTSEKRAFDIALKDCTSNDGNLKVSVTFTGSDGNNNNYLDTASGSGHATGVEIVLYDADQEVLPLRQESDQVIVPEAGGNLTLSFFAGYRQTSGNAVIPGLANGMAAFTLTYL
ncbi:fimbrial protein [Psychromonas aquimarina]|uniref:fimbrial protein n=1 Tax=Psychromonas aquimarina TaxID=444919 RepID=UPI000491B3EE|nr:fimbrial protein [Psychromonas aquimarina]